MDFIKFCEDVLDVELKEWQKAYIREVIDAPKKVEA